MILVYPGGPNLITRVRKKWKRGSERFNMRKALPTIVGFEGGAREPRSGTASRSENSPQPTASKKIGQESGVDTRCAHLLPSPHENDNYISEQSTWRTT